MALLLEGEPFEGIRLSGKKVEVEKVTLLPPVHPSKIVCVGRNYKAHAEELNNPVPEEPLLFLKPPSSLIPHEGLVRMPSVSERVDFEGELGLVIKKRAARVRREEAREYILGVTCCNDVTARDLQRKDKTFTRGKGFDTFAPVGPYVETEFDWETMRLITQKNGKVRQEGRIEDMLFPPDLLLEYISSIMTLEREIW